MNLANLYTFLAGAAGAFLAAWFGAQVGYRRSKRERALDRRVSWHEQAIQSLAHYEERLERLRGHALNVLVVHRASISIAGAPTPPDLPRVVTAPASLWAELADAEDKARAALRLADLYTEGETMVACSVALTNTVNMVAKNWTDISPEPQIPWLDLQSKVMEAANVRRSLQESLSVILELGGFLAAALGPRYRRWRAVRTITALQAKLARRAS